MTDIIPNFATISRRYDAVFVDLWGCVHNGIMAFPEAIAALRAFRAEGGRVVLVTNAPRPRHSVAAQIARMDVPDDAWDTIATSGDSARLAMFQGAVGEKVYHIGEGHDAPFFEPLKMLSDPVSISQVPLDQAEGIVCTGPFDPHADPEINRPDFLYAKAKGLKFLCANPDIVVDRGESREWCAGALAKLYTEMGGDSLYFGKPHPPIYDLARRRLIEVGGADDDRIVCIGDGPLTDVAGGMGEGLDVIFITGGLAAAETRTETQPDPQALRDYLTAEQMSPTYALGFLR
ncbi:TIGR01459 family HAD-type hydrolase [Actibacterium sp. 188UL27-1]|uniref:TIGR01459 family HAD-type hydrolase n=1 Tax=Actibacterium sp. 188UL27-1 TaxID=2786961 RepID=UPI00195C7F32|nr:TIGR01459 family HAD-type hydrolase [Actibacterium sp. 188UL27-1]